MSCLFRQSELKSLKTALKGESTCPGSAGPQSLDSGLLRLTCLGRALVNYQPPGGDCFPRLDPKWGRDDAQSSKHCVLFLLTQKTRPASPVVRLRSCI